MEEIQTLMTLEALISCRCTKCAAERGRGRNSRLQNSKDTLATTPSDRNLTSITRTSTWPTSTAKHQPRMVQCAAETPDEMVHMSLPHLPLSHLGRDEAGLMAETRGLSSSLCAAPTLPLDSIWGPVGGQ